MADTLSVRYRNHRGELATRKIMPIMVHWGVSEWHPEPQWLLDCFDYGKNAHRTYALADCDFLGAVDLDPLVRMALGRASELAHDNGGSLGYCLQRAAAEGRTDRVDAVTIERALVGRLAGGIPLEKMADWLRQPALDVLL